MVDLAVVLFRLAGTSKVIMQRRKKDKPIAPGLLGCFGGRVEVGETPLEAIRREIQEETSLDVSQLTLRQLIEAEIPNATEVTGGIRAYVFEATLPEANFEDYEGDGLEVYEFSKLVKRSDLAPSSKWLFSQL